MFIDALSFARTSGVLQGELAVGELARFCQGLSCAQPHRVSWQLAGRCEESGVAWLDVSASGMVRVVCQRCLEPFDWPVRVSNALEVLENAQQLDQRDALEASGEGPDTEYLVADSRLAVLPLVEDELILALPLAPCHDRCPGIGNPAENHEPLVDSPFAVLRQLGKN